MKGTRGRPKNTDGRLAVKATKKGKDPNKPKRPPSAFFVFLEQFRKQYKEENPNNKSVAAVGKASGEKWKSMTEADKAPYVEIAEQRKADYEKNMAAYNRGEIPGEDNDSDKSKSEVNDGAEDEEEDDEE